MIVHHVGIIVRDIDKSILILNKLGYICTGQIVIDSIQKNKIIFLNSEDKRLTIELIMPIDNTSTVNNFHEGYHHICFDVSENHDFLNQFKLLKIGKIFSKPIIAPAIHNREVVFALLYNGMYVEFIISK